MLQDLGENLKVEEPIQAPVQQMRGDCTEEHRQEKSPFFQLPGEVRNHIYRFVLESYEDTARMYDQHTYWYRPNSIAPRTCDTAFLRTCKRVYNEAWFVPWASMLHTLYLTSEDRAPEGYKRKETLQRACRLVHSSFGYDEIDTVRFYAQACWLEPSEYLQEYLDIEHFHPLCVTIAMRHTDWWYWERDRPLKLSATWVNECIFPASVREVKMELETLERKKPQLNAIVKHMKDNWHFTRRDDVRLTARTTVDGIMNWKGSSTWKGERWIGDETEPEVLAYYVVTITWKEEPDVTLDDDDWILPYDTRSITAGSRRPGDNAMVTVADLQAAGVPYGTPGDEAVVMIRTHFQDEWERARRTLL